MITLLTTLRHASHAALALLFTLHAFGEEPLPRLKSPQLPAPPQQTQPWTPPETKLAPEVVTAIGEIFQQGLADPRGCEYREIEVVVGSCWGSHGVVKTRGWVLPAQGDEQFAVAWNGLVYPLVSMGKPADLATDVRAALEKDDKLIGEARRRFDDSENSRKQSELRKGEKYQKIDWPLRLERATPEGDSVSALSLHPLRAALLLRLGEAKLAEQVWEQWFGASSNRPPASPHATLENEWLWSMFDRSVCAHMRGDDLLSLADAKTLNVLTEARAAKTGTDSDPNKNETSYLSVVPALLADEQRRVNQAPYTPVLSTTPQPEGAQRIAGLIRDLELVSARQWGQPGGVNLGEDPIVAELISMGDAAIPALIDCLENDTRLTRSVRFHRDFFPYRTLLGTHEAAYCALMGILDTSFFTTATTSDSLTARGKEGRKEIAAAVREYWQKYKGITLTDRWYQTLADEKSSPLQVMEALGNMLRPGDVVRQRSSTMGYITIVPSREPGQVPPLAGESLRAKTNPSVSELLVKRITALPFPAKGTRNDSLQQRIELTLALAKWDGKAHIPLIREAWEASIESFKTYPHGPAYRDLIRLGRARIEAGDQTALPDYTTWMLMQTPENADFGMQEAFQILWEHPSDPLVGETISKLFTVKGAPFGSLLKQKSFHTKDLVNSPLLGIPAFRTAVLKWLSDASVAGSAKVGRDGAIDLTVDNGWNGSGGSAKGEPDQPKAGTTVTLRACDVYAWLLSHIQGAPKFQLYWPAKKKDKAIAAQRQFLERFGDNLRAQPSAFDRGGREPAKLHFAALDRSATAEDAKAGKAIFSLGSPNRTFKLSQFPMTANWITLKENPAETLSYNPETGDHISTLRFRTDGKIYQAEEVLEKGKWRRYYGFVGPNQVAKVPAAEIEFPANSPFSAAPQGWDLRLEGPGGQASYDGAWSVTPEAKTSLPVTLRIRNRSGGDQTIPSALMPSAEGRLPSGLSWTLSHSPEIETDRKKIQSWTPMVPRENSVKTTAAEPGPMLAITAEHSAPLADLAKLFDLKPGSYKLQTKVKLPNQPESVLRENFFIIRE